jgi:ABC-2 type transport system ATP-binding protein
MPHVIEVAGLRKRYGRSRGVVDITYAVREGEIFGFLGPNGAGKTTTIRLLMGLLVPDGGQARIAGLDCWREMVPVKRIVGYLPGELAFEPSLTGGQILAYLANLRGGVDPREIGRLVDRFGLDPSRQFRHYSHGNRQKVGLVQAFMHRPRVVILDEPTNGLDPLNQAEFQRILGEIRQEGRTVFLSSHVLSEVEAVCDRVAIVREGRVVRVGGVAELKAIKHHELKLTFAGPAPVDAFRALGLARVEAADDGRTVSLTVHEGLDAVVKTAAQYELEAVISREPTLEEIFLHYYRAEGDHERGGAVHLAS